MPEDVIDTKEAAVMLQVSARRVRRQAADLRAAIAARFGCRADLPDDQTGSRCSPPTPATPSSCSRAAPHVVDQRCSAHTGRVRPRPRRRARPYVPTVGMVFAYNGVNLNSLSDGSVSSSGTHPT